VNVNQRLDYLRFVAELKDVAPRDVERRVGEALELCSLTEVRMDPISTLSHGYRQRAGIAQAIVHKPSLLILDEPTSGLDPVQIGEMRELIRRLAGDHTILLSSHILTEISQTCDRLLVIHEGHITADGTEEAIRKRVASAGSDEGIIEVELEGSGSGDPGPAAKAQCEKVAGVMTARIIRSEGRRISLEVEAKGDQRAAVAAFTLLVERGIEVGQHVLHALHVLGGHVAHRPRHLVDVLLHDLLAELVPPAGQLGEITPEAAAMPPKAVNIDPGYQVFSSDMAW